MLIRIVKMTFTEVHTNTFIKLFTENKKHIAAFKGCKNVQLVQDINDNSVFFTISEWLSETDLENYRQSDLFKGVWAQTKPLFKTKAEAWTTSIL